MRDFYVLIGQIFLIGLLHTIIEPFFDGERALSGKIVKIACFCGSFYLLLQFVVNVIYQELSMAVRFPF